MSSFAAQRQRGLCLVFCPCSQDPTQGGLGSGAAGQCWSLSLVAQTVGNLNRNMSISAACFWLRWDGNNSCCWKTSSRGFQEKPCDAAELTLQPIPAPGPGKCPRTSPNQPVGCESDLRGSFGGPHSHLSKQQAGKAIRLSLIISLFATSHQGKMSFQSFCASRRLWTGFTTETHQQILYFSDSHGFPYWRLMNSFWKARKSAHCCEKCFILTVKKSSNYCKMKMWTNFFIHSCALTLAYHL